MAFYSPNVESKGTLEVGGQPVSIIGQYSSLTVNSGTVVVNEDGKVIFTIIGANDVATLTYNGNVGPINGGSLLVPNGWYQFAFYVTPGATLGISAATLLNAIVINEAF